MPEHHLDARPSGKADGDASLIERPQREAAPPDFQSVIADTGALAQREREQLARDIAAIENATAALCKGEPALESWTTPTAATPPAAPRPLWILIGALWLSTALVVAGAVVAIALFVG